MVSISRMETDGLICKDDRSCSLQRQVKFGLHYESPLSFPQDLKRRNSEMFFIVISYC